MFLNAGAVAVATYIRSVMEVVVGLLYTAEEWINEVGWQTQLSGATLLNRRLYPSSLLLLAPGSTLTSIDDCSAQ